MALAMRPPAPTAPRPVSTCAAHRAVPSRTVPCAGGRACRPALPARGARAPPPSATSSSAPASQPSSGNDTVPTLSQPPPPAPGLKPFHLAAFFVVLGAGLTFLAVLLYITAGIDFDLAREKVLKRLLKTVALRQVREMGEGGRGGRGKGMRGRPPPAVPSLRAPHTPAAPAPVSWQRGVKPAWGRGPKKRGTQHSDEGMGTRDEYAAVDTTPSPPTFPRSSASSPPCPSSASAWNPSSAA